MSDSLYYEDVPPGLEFETDGILVTESHIVQFAGLSGDFYPLHMDDEFARSLGFEGRIAHGLLGLILLDGLKNRAAHRFHSVASLAWQWNFRQPICPGDRIHGHLAVTGKRLTRRGNRGILTLSLDLRNGKGEVVQDGTNLLLVECRSGRQDATPQTAPHQPA